MDCSTPGFPVHHQIPELTQTSIHWVSDAIQPSHPLSSPSPPAFNLSQHQSLFQQVSSLHQVDKGLEFQLLHVIPMSIQDWFPLGLTGWISLLSKRLSLEPRKIKSLTVSIVFPSICHDVMGLDSMVLVFSCWVLSQLFHFPLSLSSRGSSVLLSFLP